MGSLLEWVDGLGMAAEELANLRSNWNAFRWPAIDFMLFLTHLYRSAEPRL
jgi:hypothetical protein